MRAMQEAVADGIGDTGFADRRMSRRRRKLTRDERGAAFTAILDDFKEVAPVRIGQRREEPIVDGEHVQLGESGQQPRIGAITATDDEFVEQSGRADVRGREALAAGVLDEGRGEPRLADTRRAGDQEIVMLADPRARAETEHHLAGKSPRGREVNVLEAGGIPELGVAQPLREAPLLARRPLVLDQEAETVLEPATFGL